MSFRYLQAIIVASALAATAALSACSSQDADPFEEIPAFDVDPARVTLIDAGEGEKQVLSYAAEGAEQTTGIEVASGIYQGRVATDKVDPDAPEPSYTDAQALQLEVTSNGETTDVTAEGFRMRWSADPTGLITDVKLLPADDSSDEDRERLERAMLQLLSTMPVFPREEVGEGASWTAQARTTGQTSMQRTTTYTVTKIDGSTVTLDLDIDEEPGRNELSGGPAEDEQAEGADMQELNEESTTTTSQAEITVDLTAPIPVAGQNAATTRVVYSGPNPEFKVVQDITTATRYGK
ncbi:hypothetical protein [Corynebacterium appendicis]|uniref:hypothetical protein n=1 Tax=Corynebacterium appendicis TaxID=163202 RepID=UPI002550096F|nr:hypothetical protein [Corynebacterium appendicis]MDK8625354.1 hypothetical protein [Corynebacterium appendicis]